MAFKVLLTPHASKELRKLDETDRARMKRALEELAENPWTMGKPLNPSDFWGIRAGDYRAIYEINRDQNQVVVLFIGHRKKVYDDLSKVF